MPSTDVAMSTEVRIEYLTSPRSAGRLRTGSARPSCRWAQSNSTAGISCCRWMPIMPMQIAVRVARRLCNALVLPTIRVGYSPHHLGFPGTLSLRASTLESTCLDYTAHLARHGFQRVILFSGHIGNYPVMRDFEARLREHLAPLTVIMFTDGDAILDTWRECASRIGGLGENVGGHADVAETSVMLVLHPDKVRADQFARGYAGTVDQAMIERAFRDGIGSVSPNGVLGDPAGSCETIGHACLDAVSSSIAEYAHARGA